jgi:hypothetical protein
MPQFSLPDRIVELSVADTWDKAKLEWELKEVYFEDDPGACLCGKTPIYEICLLGNTVNGNEAIVGNVCVKKFLGLPSHLIFAAIKRIVTDKDKALNAEAIEHAYGKRWINKWERDFCFDTMRKKKLTDKQLEKRNQINEKLLRNVVNQLN